MTTAYQTFWSEIATRGWQATDRAQLLSFSDDIMQQLVAGTDADVAGEPVSDRLFDMIMRGFEAIQPYRAGIKNMLRTVWRDPQSVTAILKKSRQNNIWLLQALKLYEDRKLWPLVLPIIIARGFQIWVNDDEPGLSITMAAVDKAIKTARAAPHKNNR